MLFSTLKQYVRFFLASPKPIVSKLHKMSGEILQYANSGHYGGINIPQCNAVVTWVSKDFTLLAVIHFKNLFRLYDSHKSSFWSYQVGTGCHGYASPTGKEALRKWQCKLLLSASEEIHTTVYSHKSMLIDSTHIWYIMNSMWFRTHH